jgi:hypothetical protein
VLLEAEDDDEISTRFTDDDDDDALWEEVKEEEKLRRNKSEVWRKAAAVRINITRDNKKVVVFREFREDIYRINVYMSSKLSSKLS